MQNCMCLDVNTPYVKMGHSLCWTSEDVFCPPQPSRERSFWCSSQEQAQAVRQSQASHRTFLLDLTRFCRAETESASSSLFGCTKRLVQLGEKVIHSLENCTRFWLKRLGPQLGFSVLHASFDAFARMPGLYNCFWLRNRNGQALCEK